MLCHSEGALFATEESRALGIKDPHLHWSLRDGASVATLLRNKKIKGIFATDFAGLHKFFKNQSAKIRVTPALPGTARQGKCAPGASVRG